MGERLHEPSIFQCRLHTATASTQPPPHRHRTSKDYLSPHNTPSFKPRKQLQKQEYASPLV